MFGTIRFSLSILVALSHLGITLYGYNIGVASVVVFYLLAGMVSQNLISTHYKNQPLNYYKNRLKRIFPLYLLTLIFAYAIYQAGATSYFISDQPTTLSYISNLTIIPLSYYMFTSIDHFTLIPPVWSLGVELQFYLLAPFLLLKPTRLTISLLISLTIYILATTGILPTDHYGYRLILGVLFIFLLGALLHSHKNTPLLLTTYTLLVATAIYTYTTNYKAPFNHETLVALLIAIPTLKMLKVINPTPIPKPLDHYLGSLSYAIFLLHFPVLWLLTLTTQVQNLTLWVMFTTITLSIIFTQIEKKLSLFN